MRDKYKKYPLTNDVMFKAVYGSDTDESRKALMAMLNVILERKEDPIETLEIKNPINYAKCMTDKESVLDIRCRTSKGEIIGIEMQVRVVGGLDNRVVYYQGKNLASVLRRKEDYVNMKKVITICIMVENFLPDTDKFHSVFRYMDIETKKELSDISEIHFFELGKINLEKPVSEMTEAERFGAFLLNANQSGRENYVEEIKSFGDEVILMSDQILRKFTEEEILQELAEDREMFLFEREVEKLRAEMREEEFAKKDAEFAKKDAEFAKKDAEFAKKDAEFAK
ncbi:MAG: Rpn family recombination-promoting nuclease/putative transposase, partial [Anaerovoracaceae bacterium]